MYVARVFALGLFKAYSPFSRLLPLLLEFSAACPPIPVICIYDELSLLLVNENAGFRPKPNTDLFGEFLIQETC